jgi:predicted nucleotidyltransferase
MRLNAPDATMRARRSLPARTDGHAYAALIMQTQLSGALAPASLSDVERRTVERLVGRLREELGEDLHAIWLYGSRARGEEPHDESDIDLMVIADGGDERYGMRAAELRDEAADAEGMSPVWYSVFVFDPEWLRGRREIRSFFIAEADRDKIVPYGSGLE